MLTKQPGSTSTQARAPKPTGRVAPHFKPLAALRRAAVGVALSAALLSQTFPAGGARAAAQARANFDVDEEATAQVLRIPAQPVGAAAVNFSSLAAQVRGGAASASAVDETSAKFVEPPPAPPEPSVEVAAPPARSARRGKPLDKSGLASPGAHGKSATAAAPSSAPDTATLESGYGFQAQSDPGFVAPPDTQGAAGYARVLSTLRSNYVVQDKATGAVLSSVPIEVFWASTGATTPFNPRSLYDPYTNRWLLSAVSDPRSPTSSVLVGVSQTADPAGAYHLYRFDADSTDQLWADFDSLGFNKNWLVVSFNTRNVSGNQFNQGRVLALDYSAARSGTASAVLFAGISDTNGGFTMQPAVTYSQTEEAEYLVSHISSAGAAYRVSAITGTPSDPTLFIGVQKQNGLGAWSQPGGEILPQAPPPAGGPARKIESPDSHVQKVVFRNGSIYYCQTVGLPAGRQPTQVDRTAAQWTQLDSAANFVRGGRADDPGATATNGGKWYAFPSMSVNRFGDVLLGFTQFSSSQYPSAAYATHVAGDPPGSLRGPVVFKAGEGYYEKTLTGGRNLWGLYSGAQVDNVNDRDIWTIQQYAQQPAGIGPNSGRWGTWWERVPLPNRPPFVQITYLTPANQSIYIEGTDVEIRATASDPEGHVVAVEFFDGQAKIGDGVQISPGVYSITLPNVSAGTHTLTARAHDNEGGVGTSPPVTLDVRPVSILSDDFNDNSTDTWRWVIIGDRTRVLERNARLEITPPDNATGYPGYYARNLLNLTNRRATVEAVQVAPLIYGIETYFYLQEPYNGNHLMFATGGGGFILQSSANGEVSRTLISYNAAQHRFWRFRHDPADDSINFDMSPDGVTWTTYRKQPRPFNINALQAVLTCGKYTASTPAHTAVFDNYRVEDNPPSRVLLADDFNDNSADASKWFVDAPNGMTVAEQNQRLEVTPPAGNTGYGGYRSKATQDLTEATATVEVVQATPAVNGIETYFMLYESATGNYLLYAVGGMYLIEQSRDGAGVTRTYRPYDAAQHRRWRISHRWEDDTIAWETSPDGLTWTERRRAPRTFNVTALEVRLYAGKYTATTPASTAVFDNFRVERPRPALPPSDNFNDNSLDPARWVVYNPGSPSQVREQNQRLEISLQPNTVVYNGVVSAPAVNFWNKTFAVEVPQTTSQAGWVETFIMLWLDDNNFYQIVSGAGNVTADVMVNGAETRTVITYNAAAHRFWRMRHNAAAHTINFEVSGDGLSWTTFRTAPVVFSLDGMKLYLGAGAWGTGNSAPGTAIFDGAKLTPNE